MTDVMLTTHSGTDQWFGDSSLQFYEPNVHYQGRWLHRHYRLVYPLHDFKRSLTHHSSNRFIHENIVNKIPGVAVEHYYGVTLDEYLALLHLSIPLKSPSFRSLDKLRSLQSWNFTLSPHLSQLQMSVNGCLVNINNAVSLSFTFLEPLKLESDNNSSAVSWQSDCIPIRKIPRQELERCKGNQPESCHPSYYLSDLSSNSSGQD